MTGDDTTRVEGRLHVTLERVAEIYCVERVWLRRVYDRGLLGHGVHREGRILLAASRLERVATVVRLHTLFDLDPEALAPFLDEP